MKKYSTHKHTLGPRRSAYDRVLSPQELKAYVKYQLYLLERDIHDVRRDLERLRDRGLPIWPQSSTAVTRSAMVGWSSLTYLLNSHDALLRLLQQLEGE